MTESVKQALRDIDYEKARKLEEDVDMMLRVIDMIYGFEPDKYPPS